jgi:hypothetical protein
VAKTAVLDGANLCRVGYPTPTRHYPTTPDTAPLLSGGVGYLSGGLPDKAFCDEEGHKAHLEEGLSGLSGGFSGGCVAPLLPGTAGCLPGEVPGTDFADEKGQKSPLEGDLPGLPGGFSGGL